MLSNLVAVVSLAVSDGRAPVVLPTALSSYHGRHRRGCSTTAALLSPGARQRKRKRAPDCAPCARQFFLGPGDGLLDYGGFLARGAPLPTFEARTWTCPRSPAACSKLPRGRMLVVNSPSGPLRACFATMTVRAHARDGVGNWTRCPVRVVSELRKGYSVIRHTVASETAPGVSVRCALHPNVLAAAGKVVAVLGGHPYTALHVRAGDPASRHAFPA